MSYTRHYHDTISFSFDVTVYDKEGSHTETRTHTEPIDITVYVDTDNYDHNVDRVEDNLGNLTGAVVGFQSANILSKKRNEQAISQRVTTGFSTLIDQNLSMQSAGMEAEMKAVAGELLSQCKELEHKHDVMTTDYNRIKDRYGSLFDTLNKELATRIKALIRPCFDFVSQVRHEQARRIESHLLSMATTGGQETDDARIALQVTKLKRNATDLIGSAHSFIESNRSLERAKRTFCEEGTTERLFHAPVLAMATLDEQREERLSVIANDVFNAGGLTEEKVLSHVAPLDGTEMGSEQHARVTAHFDRLLQQANDGTPQATRLVALMKQLYEQAHTKTFAFQ